MISAKVIISVLGTIASNVNSIGAQRSVAIKRIRQYEDFECTLEAQICSPTREMFLRDV